MSLTIYFLRHGQTSSSRKNAFCGAGLDIDLTPEGIEMGKQFVEKYKYKKWKAIYVSPLKRTVATAKPLCKVLNMKMKLRANLKEIHYGKWEGKSTKYVAVNHHDDYIRWQADPAWNSPTGGEPAVKIARRSMKVIEEIKEKHKDGNVLIVSHKATIRIILCGILGIDVGRFRYRIGCPVSSVSKVEFTKSGPLVRVIAERSHLSKDLYDLPGT